MTIDNEQTLSESTGRQVPALVRASRIMDELAHVGKPKGVSELARALNLPKSSIHGLCQTLVDLGMLARAGDNRFCIGPHVLSWSNAFQDQSSLTLEFQRLCSESDIMTDEALNLSVMSGDSVLYVACRAGTRPLAVSFKVGMSLPAIFAATGKAMMSTMPIDEIERKLPSKWPAPITRTSVPNLAAFKIELEETRERGYSVDNGQLREGMFCVGASVWAGNDTRAIAGLAVGLLSVELTPKIMDRMGSELVEFANTLSRRLGAPK